MDGNVLKKPKWIWRILCDFDAISEDVRIATKYFEDFVWPTAVIRDTKVSKGYVIIQPILPPHLPLTLDMLENSPELSRQFDDFLQKNETLHAQTGRSFDFFGLEGMVSALVAKEGVKGNENVIHIFQKIFRQLTLKALLGRDDIGETVSITNLLVIDHGGEETIRIADPTLTNERSEKIEEKTFAYCCNSLNRKYMKKYFRKDILVQKIK